MSREYSAYGVLENDGVQTLIVAGQLEMRGDPVKYCELLYTMDGGWTKCELPPGNLIWVLPSFGIIVL